MIRAARRDEGPVLKHIAVEAKASWGYDRARVLEWADGGDFSPHGVESLRPFVAEVDGEVVAWAALLPRTPVAWLEDLWVAPAAMRRGIGTALFDYAVQVAREAGARAMEWEAEPNALPFYARVGGVRVRDSERTAWERIVPVLRVEVA